MQRVGWQKIGKNYYYFTIANGKKGSLVTGKTVNQIKLGKTGKASAKGAAAKRLKVLVAAQQFVEKATAGNPGASSAKKLAATWSYLLKNYRYTGSPVYKIQDGWDVRQASYLFRNKRGDCRAQGAAFAFLANACGCKQVAAVTSGGHGWAEVNGKVYDPTWARVDKKNNYYAMNMSLSGRNGRPNYQKNRTYIYHI